MTKSCSRSSSEGQPDQPKIDINGLLEVIEIFFQWSTEVNGVWQSRKSLLISERVLTNLRAKSRSSNLKLAGKSH
jgi:hypothetical protein